MGEQEWENANALYQRGEYVAAVRLVRPLAEQGDARAQFTIGFMYAVGQGVPQNQSEAVTWIRKAANQGYPEAQYALGVHYEKGEGVEQDHVQAHVWLNLAAANHPAYQPNPSAALLRDNIAAKKMTPEQVTEAQRLATEWKPK